VSLTDFLKLLATPHKRMLKFSGRSRRSEYWLFQVQFIFLLFFGIYGFDAAGLSVSEEYKWFNLPSSLDEVIYSLISVTFLYAFIPSVSLMSRRLHDTNRSFFWALLLFIPIFSIILLVFFCLRGTVGENRYGTDPRDSR
jgi:uncharacterized membrane protein YhaH (DUF805 family)